MSDVEDDYDDGDQDITQSLAWSVIEAYFDEKGLVRIMCLSGLKHICVCVCVFRCLCCVCLTISYVSLVS